MTDLKPVEYYLREYALAQVRIGVLRGELDKLLAIMADAGDALGGIGGNETADRLSAEAQRVSAALLGEIDSITNHCEKTVAMIASLQDPDMRAVFECRYFEGMTFSEIAKKLFLSNTKAKALHKSGLEILKDRYLSQNATVVDSSPHPIRPEVNDRYSAQPCARRNALPRPTYR